MVNNAFKDKQVSQTQLTPRPRYYNRDSVTEFHGSRDEERSSAQAESISIEQRREAVRVALEMSYEITDWEIFFREISQSGLYQLILKHLHLLQCVVRVLGLGFPHLI